MHTWRFATSSEDGMLVLLLSSVGNVSVLRNMTELISVILNLSEVVLSCRYSPDSCMTQVNIYHAPCCRLAVWHSESHVQCPCASQLGA